jgi:hypothetical protein
MQMREALCTVHASSTSHAAQQPELANLFAAQDVTIDVVANVQHLSA